MKRNEQEVLNEETRLRLEATLRCFGDVKEIIPWAGLNYAGLRRMAARLRAGTIRPVDPKIPPDILADAIEHSIAEKMLAKEEAMTRAKLCEIARQSRERYEAERVRHIEANIHHLKKSPEAHNPESPVTQKLRHLNRIRRHELGRPHTRRRGK